MRRNIYLLILKKAFLEKLARGEGDFQQQKMADERWWMMILMEGTKTPILDLVCLRESRRPANIREDNLGEVDGISVHSLHKWKKKFKHQGHSWVSVTNPQCHV